MSDEQNRKLFRETIQANWKKAKPEISSWEDLLDDEFWESEAAVAEKADKKFLKQRQADLKLIQTINSQRDQGLKAVRAATSL